MKLEQINDVETLEELLIYDDLPTEGQCDALVHVFNNFSSTQVRHVLDVGCGSGRHSFELSNRGYEVVGIDISEKVISLAENKKPKGSTVRFFVGDIRTVDNQVLFDAAYAHNSTMAYFIQETEFLQALKRIHSSLTDDGLFIFDYFYPSNLMNKGRYSERLQQRKAKAGFVLEKISRHRIDTENQIHTEESTYVLSDGKEEKRFGTKEVLKYYEPEQIRALLTGNGFSEVYLFDRDTYDPVSDETIGIYVIAKK